jgi:putative membrane protein
MTDHDEKMTEQTDEGLSRRFEIDPKAESHFAWLRTRLSLERTLMAWVRTAVSLIGFGFTIVQFFARVRQQEGAAAGPIVTHTRAFGLSLIGAGIVALVVSMVQYRWLVHYLRTKFRPLAGVTGGPSGTPLMAVAGILLVIGLAALLSVFFYP